MNKRPLVPSFLQKLDGKLLRSKPGAWASRAHLVVYFSAVFALLLFAFCYAAFFDARQNSNISSWNVFICLIVFVGFIFWLIYLLRFNVFKRYGNWFAMDGLRDFTLYFMAIAAMIALCFIPSAVETLRANHQFTSNEIVNDVNELNITACKLEYNLLPKEWTPDTCQLIKRKIAETPEDATEAVAVAADTVALAATAALPHRYRYFDSTEMAEKIKNADSVIKITDSMYIFYDCPNYGFISAYDADEFSDNKIMSSPAIYNTVLKNYRPPNRQALLNRMQQLKEKYAVDNRYGYNDYYIDGTNPTYSQKINKKYDLNRISNGMYNIQQKKYNWINNWDGYLRVFYYCSLFLTLLVFIFRHSTAKTFFLSALVAVLLTIITGLIMVIMWSSEEKTTILSFLVLYFAVFAVTGLWVFKATVRRAFQGIGLNLFVVMAPFMPLIFFALYKAANYTYTDQLEEYRIAQEQQTAFYYLIAEIAGSVLFFILIQPLFKKLYRRWYSLPED